MKIFPIFKNFGSTPALDLYIRVTIIRTNLTTIFFQEDPIITEMAHLPPGKSIDVITDPLDIATKVAVIAVLSWEYGTVSGDVSDESIILILKEFGDDVSHTPTMSPITKSDYYELNEKFECNAKKYIKKKLIEELILTNNEFNRL